jgi:hypothetical protein
MEFFNSSNIIIITAQSADSSWRPFFMVGNLNVSLSFEPQQALNGK